MAYAQLTQEQRYQIYALLKTEHSQSKIAKVVGVHNSTISREITRNKGKRGYRPKQAHQKALKRRRKARPRIQVEVWEMVAEKLRQEWSPEQISGWMLKHHDISISHEWIYQYIFTDKRTGGALYKHLRCQKKRRKRYGSYDRRGKLPNRTSIDDRPDVVDQRQRLGDWEIDTVIGKRHRGALVTLTERKSRLSLLKRVDTRQADVVSQATISLLEPFADQVHTITGDNGKEFANHETIAERLNADFFFAHPYAAWERGSNENMNGLVRQYFPKKTDFSTILDEDVETVMYKLNHRPRKCLDFFTPFEVFFMNSVALDT
jgi:IS30 family transposase